MDKFRDNGTIVKYVLILVLLLTVAFVSGVVIGKKGRTSLSEEEVEERIKSYGVVVDEWKEKYQKLREDALERGLVDDKYVLKPGVVCKDAEALRETSQEKPKPSEKSAEHESVETSPSTSPKEQTEPAEKIVEKAKPVEKTVETSSETSPKKSAEPKKSEKTEKPAANKTIDEILAEKKAEQKPVQTKPADKSHETSPQKGDVKKCHFSIQIASLNSEEQVAAAKKQFKSLKLRVISNENNGVKLYKIRTGCFDSREAADAELPQVRNSAKDAFIVSE